MRIGGLATGMDTEAIIRDMMQAHRIPLDKITQKKQYLEWQLDDYRGVNRNLKSMSDNLFSTVIQQSTFMSKTVSVSNENAVGIKSVNATSEFSGTLQIHRLATQATVHGAEKKGLDTTQTLAEAGFTGNDASITISAINKDGVLEDKKIEFDASIDTIDSVLKKINSETGVSGFYDKFTGKFSLSANNTGTNSDDSKVDISIVGGIGDFLGVSDGTAGRDYSSGQNADFTFNGLRTERSSNTFQINGFEITLKEVSESPITFSSSPDTDKVIDSVVKFVDDYNKMIEELNAKIREAKHRDFQPLSAEQKKEMSEKEIELWEEKAMSGTLKNDPSIQSMLSKLRTVMNSSVTGSDGEQIRLGDLGITPSTNYLDNGKLVINEEKLRQAISDDPNKVFEVFGKSSNTVEEQGLAIRFRSVIDEGQKVISAHAGSVSSTNDNFALGRTMKEMDNQIIRFEERMKTIENRLWKQFTAMEMAIQRANMQSASLASSFGGGM